jgi:hypothetical protein
MNNYENLFYKIDNKTSKRSDKEYRKCIVCQKDLRDKKCFTEGFDDQVGIWFSNDGQFYIAGTIYFYICTNCVSSPEEAEEKVIPLLKILYGGKIEVKKRCKITNELITFIY